MRVLFLSLSMAYMQPLLASKPLRRVEIATEEISLLRFRSPVLASVCQPALLSFSAFENSSQTTKDLSRLTPKREDDDLLEDHLSYFLTARPLKASGLANCSFSLLDKSSISVEFSLKKGALTPLIVLDSSNELSLESSDPSELELLLALVDAKLENFFDSTALISGCLKLRQCQRPSFETKLASYRLEYAGKSSELSAWVLSAKLKRRASFREFSQFKASLSTISLSASFPQSEFIAAGASGTHYVLATAKLDFSELKARAP